jgi:integrase
MKGLQRNQRDRGTGYISKKKRRDGRYEGQLRTGDGFRIVFYGKSRKAVQDKIFAYQRNPTSRTADDCTVGEWLDRWLNSVKADPQRRVATYALYKNTVDRHIRPYLQSIKLGKLTKVHVYDMLDRIKTKKGRGDRTKQIAYTTLYRALQVAFKRDKVLRNVVTLVDKPSAAKKDKVFLRSQEEIVRFRNATLGTQNEQLYLTALDTGLRQGELLALTWENVDLARGLIHVKATLTKNEEGELRATPPKTAASVRTVKLPKTTAEMLREYQKRQMASKIGLSTWIFPNWDGGPMPKDGFVRREFRRVAKKAGVPGLSFHGLRHSHATMLASLGANIKAVQERLGHSTTRMTLDVYSHVTSTMQDQAVAALDAFYMKADTAAQIGRQIGRQIEEPDLSNAN